MQAETFGQANLQKITTKFFHNAKVKVRWIRIEMCKPTGILRWITSKQNRITDTNLPPPMFFCSKQLQHDK